MVQKRMYMPNSIYQTDVSMVVSTETIEYSDTTLSLQEVATDLAEAHREINEYRNGSLVLAQKLKELRLTAERDGDLPLVNTTRELEQSAIAIFKKIEQE